MLFSSGTIFILCFVYVSHFGHFKLPAPIVMPDKGVRLVNISVFVVHRQVLGNGLFSHDILTFYL